MKNEILTGRMSGFKGEGGEVRGAAKGGYKG